MTILEAPRDDLFRGLVDGLDLRAENPDADGSLMFGHFARFDDWTEIDSWFEGRFLERIATGSFKKSMRERREHIKVQFDHGYDMHVGDSPLGPIDDLREDDQGAYYEVPLLDTDYNRDRVLPLLQGRLMDGDKRGSLLGASFRFRVTREEWNRAPKASDSNPDALPERTIREVTLYEFGPVVFPAYESATAGVRCLTDHYLERRLQRTGNAERAVRHLAPADLPTPPTGTSDEPSPDAGQATSGPPNNDAALLRLRAFNRGVLLPQEGT